MSRDRGQGCCRSRGETDERVGRDSAATRPVPQARLPMKD